MEPLPYPLDKRALEAAARLSTHDAFLDLCSEHDLPVPAAAAEVVRAAAENWRGLDPYDFCVQHASYMCVIFGGTNRLLWAPGTGFSPDRGCCTERFLERADQLGPRREEILLAINSPRG